jgi:flagellar biogenesis protein FliO
MTELLIYATALGAAGALLAGWFAFRPRRESGQGQDPSLRVVARTRVGTGRTLVLVEVDGRRLLLGSTKEEWCALVDLGTAEPIPSDDFFEGIEEELLRASGSTRTRRRLRS